jgi:hypothetical protein
MIRVNVPADMAYTPVVTHLIERDQNTRNLYSRGSVTG